MSEPIRYNCTETACDCCASVLRLGIIDAPIGEYVRYEDYACLKAENERLRKAGERLANIAHKEGYGDALGEWESAKEVQS